MKKEKTIKSDTGWRDWEIFGGLGNDQGVSGVVRECCECLVVSVNDV